MKKILFLSICAILLIAGCMPKAEIKAVDKKAINETIVNLSDKYQQAWNARNLDVLDKMINDGGLFFGTDPSEVLDKTALFKMWTDAFSDTGTDYSYVINVRKVKLADDGKSAIVVEHATIADWSPLIQLRQTLQFVEKDNQWKLDFIDWAFIAKNEDVEKLNKTLE